MKKKIIGLVSVILVVVVGVLVYYFNTSKDSSVNIDKNKSIDTSDLEEKTISSNYKITESGEYTLEGEINDTIYVNTEGVVKINLNNVNIKSSDGPCIYIENAKEVEIYLEEGTTNYLEDSSSYSDENIDGCIYSKDDLFISGEGSLNIISNYSDAIVSKDDLVINSGNINIESEDDALRGKDSVIIYDGDITIVSSGDGIKSTNDEDTEKGYVYIKNGTFNIISNTDAIQAETNLIIDDGEFTIKTGGGSENSSDKNSWGNWKGSSSDESAKGLKAGSSIEINNGTFNINSSDDAVHSNGNVVINSGEFTISSGDDGIHADSNLTINNGNVTINKSYEGLEASIIDLNGGNIDITASDDGINGSGGSDSSGSNRAGASMFQSDGSEINLNGSNVTINATGDGIDSNGDINMSSGNVTVYGPTNDGNGAIDKNGDFKITGGILIASGSSGMAEYPESGQNTVIINFNTSINKETITITDEDGNYLFAHRSSKTFNNLVYSSNLLENNKTYKILINGEDYASFTISSNITKVGNSSGGMNQGNMNPGRR